MKHSLTFITVLLLTSFVPIFSLPLESFAKDTQENSIVVVSWSHDGSQIATGSTNGEVVIWDANTGLPTNTLQGHTERIEGLAWNVDGIRLLSASFEEVNVWNVPSETSNSINDPITALIVEVAWHPITDQIYTLELEGTIRVWDSQTFNLVRARSTGSMVDIAWSPDNSKVALANYASGAVVVWNGDTLASLFSFPRDEDIGGRSDIYHIEWSNNGNYIASGDVMGRVIVWNLGTQHSLYILNGTESTETGYDTSSIRALHFGDADSTVSSISADGIIRTWDTTNGDVINSSQLGSPVKAAAWSPDGQRIAYSDDSGNLNITSDPISRTERDDHNIPTTDENP